MAERIVILTYHQVGDFAPPPRRHLYCHHERFALQMAYLSRHDYRVLSMNQVVACLKGEIPTPPRAVALTFDDGYENFYHYAYPVLARYKFPAIVYVISGFIGQRATWYDPGLGEPPALMGRERIRELSDNGIDFGAHGVNHVRLGDASPERAREELTRSKSDLETLLGRAVRHCCYPYGSYNPAVIDAARAAGYLSAVTCVRAAATPTDDLLALPRKAISYRNRGPGFFWKLRT